MTYKHHVAIENVRPNKVFEAAKWLVKNSPIFRNEGIVLDDHWLQNPENSTSLFESESNPSCDKEEDNLTEDENF